MITATAVACLLRSPGTHPPDALARIIDVMYEVEPGPGAWTLVTLDALVLRGYFGLATLDEVLVSQARQYATLPSPVPPVLLVGAERAGEQGLGLLDGRRRICAAAGSSGQRVRAILPSRHEVLCRSIEAVACSTSLAPSCSPCLSSFSPSR